MLVTVAGVVSGEFHEDYFSFVILVRVNLKQQKGLGDGGRNSWRVFGVFLLRYFLDSGGCCGMCCIQEEKLLQSR